jgi:hypothetical protein
MGNKFLRFGPMHETTSYGLDGHRYHLAYEIGEKRGDLFFPLQSRHLEVQASGTLQAIWGKSDPEMAVYSATAAALYILDLARKNGLDTPAEPLHLNTYTAPKVPPESPRVEPGVLIPLEEVGSAQQPPAVSFLSDDVSELRDQINALAKDLWGERLLLLSQERPLLDMYKSARNADEFRLRVQSLGIIAKDLNRDLLRRVAGTEPAVQIGDFVLLETVLTPLASGSTAAKVCGPLKQLNNLRQGYPTHGDNAKKFLEAHRYFGLDYPVTDFSEGWEAVLASYFNAIRELRDVLSAEWKRRAGR